MPRKKQSELGELVAEMVEESQSQQNVIRALANQNQELLQYIIDFHEAMSELSSKMEKKTDEMLKRIANQLGIEDDE